MQRLNTRLRSLVSRLWQTDAPLTAVGLLMLGLLGAALVGIWADPRTITGAPAWLKPAKFAASIAIYTLTLAWVFTYLQAWTRTRRLVSWTTAVVLVVEMAIIVMQAVARHDESFQRRHAARRDAVHRDGREHRAADPRGDRRCRRVVAPEIR